MHLSRKDRALFMALALAGAVTVLGLCGCASPAAKVLASVNAYEYHVARHAEVCPAAPTCKADAVRLQKWSKALDEAKDALKRGGKMPLQMRALDEAEKAVAK